MKRNTSRIALCGVIAGLSVAVMLTSAIDIGLTYSLPMIAGGLLIIPAIEFGTKTAVMTYAATGLLSLLLPANKEAALFYVFLFGLYPILKKFFDPIRLTALRIAVKFLYFNLSAAAALGLSIWIFQIPFDDGGLGKFAVPLLLVLGNIAFFVYDIALSKCVGMYLYKFQPILRKTFHIEKKK